jgi:hypothetical protein
MSRNQEWQGQYFGEDGAIKHALFSFGSTLYGAAGSKAPMKQRILCALALLFVYITLRVSYAVDKMSASELDLLASFSRAFRQRRYAIDCGERAAKIASTPINRLLILSGLVRDWEAFFPASAGGHESGRYFRSIVELLAQQNSDSQLSRKQPEQMARVYRTLAWFTDRYGNADKQESRGYADIALALAQTANAQDQVDKLMAELPHLLSDR